MKNQTKLYISTLAILSLISSTSAFSAPIRHSATMRRSGTVVSAAVVTATPTPDEEKVSIDDCFTKYRICMDQRVNAIFNKYNDFMDISQEMNVKFYNETNPPKFRCIFSKDSKNILLNRYYGNGSSTDGVIIPSDGSIAYYQGLIDQINKFSMGTIKVQNLDPTIIKDARAKRPKKAQPIPLKTVSSRIIDLNNDDEYTKSNDYCKNSATNDDYPKYCERYNLSISDLYTTNDDSETIMAQLGEKNLDFTSIAKSCKDFQAFASERALSIVKEYNDAIESNKADIKKKMEIYNNKVSNEE